MKSVGLVLVLILLASTSALGDYLVETNVQFITGNETYKVKDTMQFNVTKTTATAQKFNESWFNHTSTNPITMYMEYLSPNITAATTRGNRIVEFNGSAIGGTQTFFNISGLIGDTNYSLFVDNIYQSTHITDSNGWITWNWNSWSDHQFDIFYGDYTPVEEGGGGGTPYVVPPYEPPEPVEDLCTWYSTPNGDFKITCRGFEINTILLPYVAIAILGILFILIVKKDKKKKGNKKKDDKKT